MIRKKDCAYLPFTGSQISIDAYLNREFYLILSLNSQGEIGKLEANSIIKNSFQNSVLGQFATIKEKTSSRFHYTWTGRVNKVIGTPPINPYLGIKPYQEYIFELENGSSLSERRFFNTRYKDYQKITEYITEYSAKIFGIARTFETRPYNYEINSNKIGLEIAVQNIIER
jgi:hypothetical protein